MAMVVKAAQNSSVTIYTTSSLGNPNSQTT